MRWTRLVVGAALLALAGCGKYEPAPMPAKPAAPQASAPAKPAPAPAPAPAPQSGMTVGMQGIGTAVGMAPLETAVSGPMGVAPARPATPPPPPAPAATAVKADSGVGARGQGYGPGIITTPVATYFRAKEQIAFRIQIPDAMRLYKAMNGHAPKTHEEFMEKIIKENRIQLPELPPGHRYRYYPEQEELMVEHPAP